MLSGRDAQVPQVSAMDDSHIQRPNSSPLLPWKSTLSLPFSGQGRAHNQDRWGAFPSRVGALLGSLNPGLDLGSLDSLGGHLGHSLQAPVASCREVVLVAAQVQSLQPGTHRAKGGEGREGTVSQGGGRPGEQRNHCQSTRVWPERQEGTRGKIR